ncbi:hypothetical protein NLG97_g1394 [Lecanicillium saksenae]|uniref:Uncharacterized protein n=1 Tax=Lecanicillium saksenae TaxID=468837 RepID=A0ACC1R770_9HYPO|nr:hypothetical protein NLG97_g1394 [Lecanicillium saksenae]
MSDQNDTLFDIFDELEGDGDFDIEEFLSEIPVETDPHALGYSNTVLDFPGSTESRAQLAYPAASDENSPAFGSTLLWAPDNTETGVQAEAAAHTCDLAANAFDGPVYVQSGVPFPSAPFEITDLPQNDLPARTGPTNLSQFAAPDVPRIMRNKNGDRCVQCAANHKRVKLNYNTTDIPLGTDIDFT